jgi:hypothetical protein
MNELPENVKADDYLEIDKYTFNSWKSFTPISDPFKATVILDNVHDSLGHHGQKATPGNWEDKIIESTRDKNDNNLKILDILNTNSKCIIINDNENPHQNIPYKIPDNNEVCYVKDCFPGTCIPGLNNLLDQSCVSLESFNAKVGLKNPMTNFPLCTQKNMLFYTAYFNFDLLIFKYIYDKYNNVSSRSKVLSDIYNNKIKPYIENTSDNIFDLEPNDIQIINTVNLNYVWSQLLVYCYDSVFEDGFLTQKEYIDDYKSMINNLLLIRFHGFELNAESYIKNPTYIHRNSKNLNHSRMIMDQNTVDVINDITKNVYTKHGVFTGFDDEAELDDDNQLLQYVTSQAMAANSITSILGKLKSVIARTSEVKDKIKNACMRSINILLGKNLEARSKKKRACGWSILKFSGDSSHIVYGDIIEKAIEHQNQINQIKQINTKVVYLVSERPLAGRILTKQKDIIILATNVFIKNFIGPGSDFKNEKHAALHVTFDFKTSYHNVLDSIRDKITNVLKKKMIFENAINYLKRLNDNKELPDNMPFIVSNVIGITVNNDSINQEAIQDLNEKVKDFLTNYDKDILTDNYNKSIANTDFKLFAETFIGTNFAGIRIGRSAQWFNLISQLKDNPGNPYIRQYDEFNKLIRLILSQNANGYFDTDDSIDSLKVSLNKSPSFYAIYQKITNSYYANNKHTEKYNSFEDDRIRDWTVGKNSKSTSGKIPNDVQFIITQLKEFVDQIILLKKFFHEKNIDNPKKGGDGENIEKEDIDDELIVLKYGLLSSNQTDYNNLENIIRDQHPMITKNPDNTSNTKLTVTQYKHNGTDNSVITYLNNFIDFFSKENQIIKDYNREEIYEKLLDILAEKCFNDLITFANDNDVTNYQSTTIDEGVKEIFDIYKKVQFTIIQSTNQGEKHYKNAFTIKFTKTINDKFLKYIKEITNPIIFQNSRGIWEADQIIKTLEDKIEITEDDYRAIRDTEDDYRFRDNVQSKARINKLASFKEEIKELYNITYNDDDKIHYNNLRDFFKRINQICDNLTQVTNKLSKEDKMITDEANLRNCMEFIINFNKFYSKNDFLFTHITCKKNDASKGSKGLSIFTLMRLLPKFSFMGGKKKRITRKRRIIENKKRITKRNKKRITKRNKKKLKRGKSMKSIKF